MSDNLPISEQFRVVANAMSAFEARYIPEPNSGCWLWLGMMQVGKLYGLFCFKQKTTKAHRASYALHRGPFDRSLCVLHRCDNPACVNPEHLTLGTQADNILDMDRKGRRVSALGEQQHLSKLTPSLVKEIRQLAGSGLSYSQIARVYSLHAATVGRIVTRRTWRHV